MLKLKLMVEVALPFLLLNPEQGELDVRWGCLVHVAGGRQGGHGQGGTRGRHGGRGRVRHGDSGGVELAVSSLIRPLQSELAYVRLIIIYMTLLLSHPPMPGGLGKPAGVGRVPGDSGAVVVGRQGDSCPLPGIAHNSFVSKVGVKPHADNAVGKP